MIWVNPKLKLKVNDEFVTVSTELASTFNKHFYSVARVLNANIPNLPDCPIANIKVKTIKELLCFTNTVVKNSYNIILSFKSKSAKKLCTVLYP